MYLEPADKDPVKIADWAETEALYSQTGRVSFEALRAGIDMDGTAVEDIQDDEETEGAMEEERVLPGYSLYEQSEVMVADVMAEIERRISIAKEAYPFKLSSGMLRLRTDYDKCLPYIFCLLVADRAICSASAKLPPRLFEHLVTEALEKYLGGKAVRFGWPRDTMPAVTNDAIDKLAEMMKDERIDGYPVRATDKDLGLDVAGWKSFPDERISKIEVFMQCATGEGWEEKRGECVLVLNTWAGILSSSHGRLSGLAIPYTVADNEDWTRLVAGLIFMDRIRIASVISSRSYGDNSLSMRRWCKVQIRKGNQKR